MRTLLAVVASAALIPTPLQDLSSRELESRATAYVAAYQQQLTSIVADEEYTQEILAQSPVDPAMPRTRRLRSEIFFMFEPADGVWMAIRDTILVDGVPVRDRPSVRLALESRAPAAVARQFARLNAQWNIGKVTRNFNEPTLALLAFDRRHQDRFSFKRRSVERTAEATLITLEFRERERPTLIRDLDLRPIYSRGEILLEPDGRVRRTVFRVEADAVKVELTTDYAPNEKLGIWVPARFRERYERIRGGRELVVCEALYTNYRRFDVTTRIK